MTWISVLQSASAPSMGGGVCTRVWEQGSELKFAHSALAGREVYKLLLGCLAFFFPPKMMNQLSLLWEKILRIVDRTAHLCFAPLLLSASRLSPGLFSAVLLLCRSLVRAHYTPLLHRSAENISCLILPMLRLDLFSLSCHPICFSSTSSWLDL